MGAFQFLPISDDLKICSGGTVVAQKHWLNSVFFEEIIL